MISESTGELLMTLVAAAFVILVLCLPGAIAQKRHHNNTTAIWICGFLLWPVGLIWSLTGNVKGENEDKLKTLQAEVNAAKIASLQKELNELKATK